MTLKSGYLRDLEEMRVIGVKRVYLWFCAVLAHSGRAHNVKLASYEALGKAYLNLRGSNDIVVQ